MEAAGVSIYAHAKLTVMQNAGIHEHLCDLLARDLRVQLAARSRATGVLGLMPLLLCDIV